MLRERRRARLPGPAGEALPTDQLEQAADVADGQIAHFRSPECADCVVERAAVDAAGVLLARERRKPPLGPLGENNVFDHAVGAARDLPSADVERPLRLAPIVPDGLADQLAAVTEHDMVERRTGATRLARRCRERCPGTAELAAARVPSLQRCHPPKRTSSCTHTQE